MRLGSAGREEVAPVRWDVTADLEHDLCAWPEPQPARIVATSDAVDIDGDSTMEGRETGRPEWLTPDAEETTERRPALVVDDAARVERPHGGTAVGGEDAADVAFRAFEPYSRRDDDHPPPREEFDVHARTDVQPCWTTDEASTCRPCGGPISGSCSDGRRRDPQDACRRPDRQDPQKHRHQAMRTFLGWLACAALAAIVAAPPAKADGDPASDYLVAQQVFLSYDAKIPTPVEHKLLSAVASANKNGFPVRVALIWSSYDLGSVPELFGKPRTYARFLDAEDSKCWWGGSCGSGRFKTTTRLLVVMPNGLGFAQWRHAPAAGYRTLAGIKVERTPGGLAGAATTAVVKLASAAGVRTSTRGGSSTSVSGSGSSGTSRTEILVAVIAALLLGAAASLVIRRRARSRVR
jgi:hypothetical protein